MSETDEKNMDGVDKKTPKRRRATNKGKFTRICNKLYDLMKQSEEMEILKYTLRDSESAYADLEQSNAEYLDVLDPDHTEDKTEIHRIDADTDTTYSELCTMRVLVSQISSKQKHAKKEESKAEQSIGHGLHVKKLDPPKFDGNIREYPAFKQNYDDLMKNSFGTNPYALRSCLSGNALETVKGVDNDYEEMFRRLDLKYGRPEKLVDVVISDLQGIGRVDDDNPKAFIEMVDKVEKCWLDLKKMGMESEMDNATMTSRVEKLLPSVQRREWSLQKLKSKRTGFIPLLDFMLEEKAAMDYMESDIRETRSPNTSNAGACSSLSLSHSNSSVDNMFAKVIDGLTHLTDVMTQNAQSNRGGQNASAPSRGKKCWYHDSNSHDIGLCYTFERLDHVSKMDLLRRNGACLCCLKLGHLSRNCQDKKPCDVIVANYQKCGKMHHPFIHEDPQAPSSTVLNVLNDKQGREGVVLMVSKVDCQSSKLTALWDPGPNMSIITHRAASKLGLRGKQVTMSVTKVGNITEDIESKEYVVPLRDQSGKVWEVKMYGMDDITAKVANIDVSRVSRLFKGISERDIQRPSGEVEILVGTDCCTLLPNKVDQIGNLQLMRNQFGYCLRGSHSLIRVSTSETSNTIRLNYVNGHLSKYDCVSIEDSKDIKSTLDSFFNVERLGTHCIPRCGGCKCGKCQTGDGIYTIAEQRELELIEKGLKYDANDKQWIVSYPWIKDPNDLPNNYDGALARMKSTERRLQKLGSDDVQLYNEQMSNMLDRGVARKLTFDEMMCYRGPVHYIPHHEVHKPDSQSTPLRIVFNSSATFMGHDINSFWAKGPNILNDLLKVLVRFRQGKVALVGDISKMYNTVKLSPEDQHTHRFLWRNMDDTRPPDHYALTSVPFGDRPSGAIAISALRLTAEMNKDSYPDATKAVLKDSYVDDILTSEESVKAAEALATSIDRVLESGGFAIKHWTISGSHDFTPKCQSGRCCPSSRQQCRARSLEIG